MKKFLLLVSLLLVVPNVAMGAESTAPSPNAAPSKWLSWFRGVPHLTMDHLAKARAYMYSKWRCMARGEGCSKRQRNALRALSVAIIAAASVVTGVAVKSRVDRNKRATAVDAFRDAATADAATYAADAAAAAKAFRAAAAAETAFRAADAATADDAADDAADAAFRAFRAAADIFSEVETELRAVYTTYAAAKAFRAAAATAAAYGAADAATSATAAAYDAADAALRAARNAARDAVRDAARDADPKRAKALEALDVALHFPSATNLTAVEDAIKAMDAQ